MIDNPKNLVGDQVRRLRLENGWTQQRAAAECLKIGWDLSRAGLSKVEAGIRRVNDAELILLAELLKVPLDEFFGDLPGARKTSRKKFLAKAGEVARHSRD